MVDCCCHFLETHLDPYNAIGIAEFANQHGCTALTRVAREFIDKNFAEVSQNEEFLQLSGCQLINLVKRDELVVHAESEVSWKARSRYEVQTDSTQPARNLEPSRTTEHEERRKIYENTASAKKSQLFGFFHGIFPF